MRFVCSMLSPLLRVVTEMPITLVTVVVVVVMVVVCVILKSILDLIPQDTVRKGSSGELPPRKSVWNSSSPC